MLQSTSTKRRAAGGDRPRSGGSVKTRPLLAGAVHEHQYLASANHGGVIHVVAVENRHAARVDIKAIAEPRAYLADAHVRYRKALRVRTGGHRHEVAGLFFVIVEEAAAASAW